MGSMMRGNDSACAVMLKYLLWVDLGLVVSGLFLKHDQVVFCLFAECNIIDST